jgi:MFS family permease
MKKIGYRNYLLAVLMVILAFNNADGLALGLVLQDIKVDLHLSDTQLGLLSGIAFALFYAVMGIPVARWADRGNRVTIISLTAALWSVMVALCGLAASFAQLLVIRIGVAIGEAGCIPPAYSLIPDHFTRPERPRAVAVYLLGSNLSFGIGYFLAGWLNQLYGWRVTFMLLGLPGLVPAVLAWFTLREPRRGQPVAALARDGAIAQGTRPSAPLPTASPASAQPTLREVGLTLWANTSFRHLLLSFAVAGFFATGVLQWLPTFFVRSYGLSTGQLGTWFGLIWGLGGFVGTYWGGAMASRHAANNERLQLKAMALAYCAFAVFSGAIYVSPNHYLALGFMAMAVTGLATTNGPVLATIQTLVPSPMRATSIAIIYLFSNLIGLGLGPLAVGALSDALRPLFGEESLRYALLTMSPGYLWGAWHLWRASRTVTRDLEAAQDDHDRGGAALSVVPTVLEKGGDAATVT